MNDSPETNHPEIPMPSEPEVTSPQEPRWRRPALLGGLIVALVLVAAGQLHHRATDETPAPPQPEDQGATQVIEPLPLLPQPPMEPDPAPRAPLTRAQDAPEPDLLVEPAPPVEPAVPVSDDEAEALGHSVSDLVNQGDVELARRVANTAVARSIGGEPRTFNRVHQVTGAPRFKELGDEARGLQVRANPYKAIRLVNEATRYPDLAPLFPSTTKEMNRLANAMVEVATSMWAHDKNNQLDKIYQMFKASHDWLGRDGEAVEFEATFREVQQRFIANRATRPRQAPPETTTSEPTPVSDAGQELM